MMKFCPLLSVFWSKAPKLARLFPRVQMQWRYMLLLQTASCLESLARAFQHWPIVALTSASAMHGGTPTPMPSGAGGLKNTYLRWTAEGNGLHRPIETSKLAMLFGFWSQLVQEVTILLLARWNWFLATTLLPTQPKSELPLETWSVPLSNLPPFSPFPIPIKNLSLSMLTFFHFWHSNRFWLRLCLQYYFLRSRI